MQVPVVAGRCLQNSNKTMKQADTTRKLRVQGAAFCAVRTTEQLAALLHTPSYQLVLMAAQPVYYPFAIPKKDGTNRWIEDPYAPLKKVQRTLNVYLQSVYFFIHPDPAYGFMITVKDDPLPRNILTHAQQHLGCKWLYNADVEDFFHKISAEAIYRLLTSKPFTFDHDCARLITGLVCYQERLPMGAPTSPILSNFAALEMDRDLESLAAWAQWRYTRFADDMSFSSFEEMLPEELDKIEAVVKSHGFTFNPQKVKLMGPDDAKEVTGLRLEETVKLPPGFMPDVKKEIDRFKGILEAEPKLSVKTGWVKKYRQQIEGALSFAAFVNGYEHPSVQEATDLLDQALHPELRHGALSWMEFGYF